MNSEPLQDLVDLARDGKSSDDDLRRAAQTLLEAVSRATPRDANAALASLAGHIGLDDVSRGAFLALVCGALVEEGCDPAPLIEPLNQRLHYLLESAAELADLCREQLPEKSQDDDQDPAEEFDRVLGEVAGAMPLESEAWQALRQFWRPAIAVYSVCPPARMAARHMRGLAARIAEFHEGGHWLRLMLSVLDDEPMVVIEPATSTGILARISGVVDNFQLNVLLMDAFPHVGTSGRRRVAKQVADVARGDGPQQTEDTVTGAWNLYSWQAIEPDLNLPDTGDSGKGELRVWNEDIPEDIPVFEGRRAILLGPASYARNWRSQRMFDKLPARLECERQLDEREIHNWLQRMLATR